MQLTPEQKDIIRKSHKMLLPEIDRVAGEFYADLFRRDDRIKELFRQDLSAQGMRFMSTVSVIVDNLDNPERLEHEIGLLAKGHAPMGIRPEWYHVMEEALIDTFRYALGARFSPEMQLAWRDAFGQICDAMKTEANES